LVGVIFRRQDRDRRVVPVHASESDDAAGYLYHPVSDTIKNGNCGLSCHQLVVFLQPARQQAYECPLSDIRAFGRRLDT